MKNIIIVCLFLVSCASIQTLDGGDKDQVPPRVLNSIPDSATLGVTKTTFIFNFDEYIKTTKVKDLLIISPGQKINPIVSVKGKKLTIKLQDTLIPNTTYTFQFNGCIVDNNESNPLNDYNFIFSTGTYLDSLTSEGTVIDIVSNKPCTDCNVHLYTDFNDSMVLTDKPYYLTKTNDKGEFTFYNLPNDSFNQISIRDENKNLKLDPEEYVSLSRTTKSIHSKRDTLYVFPTLDKLKTKVTVDRKSKPGTTRLLSSKPILTNDIKLLINNEEHVYRLSNTKDTITTFYTPTEDTTYLQVIIDSDTTSLSQVISLSKLKYNVKLKLQSISDTLTLSSLTPIRNILSDQITLYKDTIPYTPLYTNFINTTLYMTSNVPLDSLTHLVIAPNGVTDVFNQTNKGDTIKIKRAAVTNSNLTIKIKLTDTLQHLIYLKSNNKVQDFIIINSDTTLVYNNIKPLEYQLLVIKDTNRNGLWDTGDLFTRKRPEIRQLSEQFEIRNNWDKQLIINVL